MSEEVKQMDALMSEMQKLRDRYELSKTVQPDYYEPGKMEYLDKYYGSYDEKTGEMVLRFPAGDTRSEGRTERIETLKQGSEARVVRDSANPDDKNHFSILDSRGLNVGSVPAELGDALAPLSDAGRVEILSAAVSYVEPLSKRSRYARQAILFIELHLRVKSQGTEPGQADEDKER